MTTNELVAIGLLLASFGVGLVVGGLIAVLTMLLRTPGQPDMTPHGEPAPRRDRCAEYQHIDWEQLLEKQETQR